MLFNIKNFFSGIISGGTTLPASTLDNQNILKSTLAFKDRNDSVHFVKLGSSESINPSDVSGEEYDESPEVLQLLRGYVNPDSLDFRRTFEKWADHPWFVSHDGRNYNQLHSENHGGTGRGTLLEKLQAQGISPSAIFYSPGFEAILMTPKKEGERLEALNESDAIRNILVHGAFRLLDQQTIEQFNKSTRLPDILYTGELGNQKIILLEPDSSGKRRLYVDGQELNILDFWFSEENGDSQQWYSFLTTEGHYQFYRDTMGNKIIKFIRADGTNSVEGRYFQPLMASPLSEGIFG